MNPTRTHAEIIEGWAMPINSKRFHFFSDSRSLCGKWMFLAKDLDADDPSTTMPRSDDCKECFRRLRNRP